MPLTDAQTRALDALDEDEVIATLVDLVRVPSVTGTDAESELQHRQAALFETEGLEVDTWQLDLEALRADPRFPGTEADRSEGYGLVARPAATALQDSSCRATSTSCRSATPRSGSTTPSPRASRQGGCTAVAPVT